MSNQLRSELEDKIESAERRVHTAEKKLGQRVADRERSAVEQAKALLAKGAEVPSTIKSWFVSAETQKAELAAAILELTKARHTLEMVEDELADFEVTLRQMVEASPEIRQLNENEQQARESHEKVLVNSRKVLAQVSPKLAEYEADPVFMYLKNAYPFKGIKRPWFDCLATLTRFDINRNNEQMLRGMQQHVKDEAAEANAVLDQYKQKYAEITKRLRKSRETEFNTIVERKANAIDQYNRLDKQVAARRKQVDKVATVDSEGLRPMLLDWGKSLLSPDGGVSEQEKELEAACAERDQLKALWSKCENQGLLHHKMRYSGSSSDVDDLLVGVATGMALDSVFRSLERNMEREPEPERQVEQERYSSPSWSSSTDDEDERRRSSSFSSSSWDSGSSSSFSSSDSFSSSSDSSSFSTSDSF